jgi:hypothetical protein
MCHWFITNLLHILSRLGFLSIFAPHLRMDTFTWLDKWLHTKMLRQLIPPVIAM